MDFLDKAYDRASCEIEDILQHQSFDKQDVELLGDFIDIVKDIMMTYDYQSKIDDYSQMDSFNRGRSGRMMPMYNRGSSYMRGRSMSNGYSRSDNKEILLDHLQEVMDMAVDEKDKRAVERLMEQMSKQPN